MSSFEDLDDLRERNKQLLVRLREQRMRLQRLTDPDCPGSGEIRRRPVDSSASPVGSVVTGIGGRQGLTRTALSKPKTLDEGHPPAASHKKAQDVSETSILGKDIVPLRGPSQREWGSAHHDLLQDERNIDLGRERKSEAMTSGLDFRSVRGEQHNGDSLVRRSTEPLLGYDWIAGLLDADSSSDDRTDQFFTELHNFRQVNKEECIHSLHTWVERDEISPPSLLTHERAMEREVDKHTCMFRYRINSRLFPTPSDCQAACPMCKMPKSQHAHTVAEPAFIRVSVPCAVLLPASQHRVHHRNSFDPSDSLGLSSHCLSGWSRSAPVAARLPSSLDLRSCLVRVLPEPELTTSLPCHRASLSKTSPCEPHVLFALVHMSEPSIYLQKSPGRHRHSLYPQFIRQTVQEHPDPHRQTVQEHPDPHRQTQRQSLPTIHQADGTGASRPAPADTDTVSTHNPSGGRYRSIQTRTGRHRDSFYPQSIRLLNC